MKRAVSIGAAALLIVLVVVWTRTGTDATRTTTEITDHKSQITNSEPTNTITHDPSPIPPTSPPAESLTNDVERNAAAEDIRKLKSTLGSFLLLLKDPYRPPLGDNQDITRALTGHNRRNIAAIPTNDPAIVNGQLVDRWGTPYWFHPRTPDAIDIISAGPDRELFTPDDIASENFSGKAGSGPDGQSLEKPARKVPEAGRESRGNIQ